MKTCKPWICIYMNKQWWPPPRFMTCGQLVDSWRVEWNSWPREWISWPMKKTFHDQKNSWPTKRRFMTKWWFHDQWKKFMTKFRSFHDHEIISWPAKGRLSGGSSQSSCVQMAARSVALSPLHTQRYCLFVCLFVWGKTRKSILHSLSLIIREGMEVITPGSFCRRNQPGLELYPSFCWMESCYVAMLLY